MDSRSENQGAGQGEGLFSQTVLQFLAPIKQYLLDPLVSEIMVNGPEAIYIEKQGKIYRTDSRFNSEESLMAAIRNVGQFMGRTIDTTRPYLDARLPDGSRVHAIIAPCAPKGPYLTIRRFSQDKLTMDDLIAMGSMDRLTAVFLEACVVARKNIAVSGGTSSGKTTLLNIISSFIPAGERVVVIEDSCELQLRQEHLVNLERKWPDKDGRGEVSIGKLLENSLRMRPDRIIIGECRAGEALDMLQAMNTGHAGSMTTLHANSCRDALSRLETMALSAGAALPLAAIRGQVASAIDLVVQISRFPNGKRLIVELSEVQELSLEGNYQLNPIFQRKLKATKGAGSSDLDSLRPTGNEPSFIFELELTGIDLGDNLFARSES